MIKRHIKIFAMILVGIIVAFAFSAPMVKRKAESISCGNFMSSIGCAARFLAGDHDDRLPSDLLSMSNELIMTKILICPGDHARQAAPRWDLFTLANSSYEIVTSNLLDRDTNGMFLRCKIHDHIVYVDATVFDGIRSRKKIP